MAVKLEKLYKEKIITVQNQALSAHEEAEKIAKSESFEELQAWACPKALANHKDWFMVCVSCPGVATCKPGKRAMELLEMQTKPDEKSNAVEKFNVRMNKSLTRSKELYLEALKSGDPIHYLTHIKHYGKEEAARRMEYWKKIFPDIQREEQLRSVQTAAQAHRTQTRESISAAFESGEDPIEYIMKTEGKTQRNSRGKIYNAARAYPDLEKKYHIYDYLANNRRTPRGLKKEIPESEPEPNDEMSLEDLFEESGVQPIETKDANFHEDIPKPEPDLRLKNLNELVQKEKEQDQKAEKQNILCSELSAKRIELLKAIDLCDETIEGLRKQITFCEKKKSEHQDNLIALDRVAAMLGLEPKKPIIPDSMGKYRLDKE